MTLILLFRIINRVFLIKYLHSTFIQLKHNIHENQTKNYQENRSCPGNSTFHTKNQNPYHQ